MVMLGALVFILWNKGLSESVIDLLHIAISYLPMFPNHEFEVCTHSTLLACKQLESVFVMPGG